MDYKMNLTPEQREILEGSRGETMAKVMETMIRYGELFGAERMIPITGEMGHLVTSFGLKGIKAIYELLDQLLEAGAVPDRSFTVDPRPLDRNVPAGLLQKLVFHKIMYTRQEPYEEQLKKFGLKDENGFTCTCYMDEVGNIPKKGDILSWSESSAVVYANSVLGARCNRNSGVIDIMGAIVGFVPDFGLTTDEGRKATWIVEVKTTKRPEAQLLGSAIGMKVVEEVPYIVGLDRWLGNELNEPVKSYLKDMGAATASNGAVGLFHVEGVTPEAAEQGRDLIAEGAQVYVIDDAELQRVYDNYPVIWKDPQAKPKLCFIGCPHLSLVQLKSWTKRICKRLQANGQKKVTVPTVMTAAPDVIRAFEETPYAEALKKTGVVLSYICPLMYMNNPLCGSVPTITCSNKLRTYTTAKYYTEAEILDQITGGAGV